MNEQPDDPLPPVLSGVLTPEEALGIARDALVRISNMSSLDELKYAEGCDIQAALHDIHRIASTALARSFIYPGEGK